MDRRSAAGARDEEGEARRAGGDADKKPDADAADKAAADKPAADTTQKPAAEPQAKPAAETPPAPAATIRNARRLTTGTDVEHGPVWSPDGQFIAYVTWNDDDGGRIYRVRADGGGQPERLTPVAAFYDKLTYSRDGSRLIGVRGSKMHRLRTLEDFGNHSGSAELEYVWLPATGGTVSRIAWAAGGSTQQGREAPHVGSGSEPHLRLGRIRRTAVDALRRHRRQADREGHGAGSAAAAGRAARTAADA